MVWEKQWLEVVMENLVVVERDGDVGTKRL